MRTDAIVLDKRGYDEYLRNVEAAEAKFLAIQTEKEEFIEEHGTDVSNSSVLLQYSMDEQAAFSAFMHLSQMKDRIEVVSEENSTDTISINDTFSVCITSDFECSVFKLKLVLCPSDISKEISIESPLGMVAYGKRVRDSFSYYVNKVQFQATILEIY